MAPPMNRGAFHYEPMTLRLLACLLPSLLPRDELGRAHTTTETLWTRVTQ